MPEPAAEQPDATPRSAPARRREVRIVATAAIGLTITVVVWWLFLRLRGFLLLLLVALFVSLALEPPVGALARRGWRRGLATFAVLFVTLLLTLVFLATIGAVVASQVSSMVQAVPHLIQDAIGFANLHFHTHINPNDVFGRLSQQNGPLRNLATSIASSALNVGISAFGVLFDVLTIGLFAFYLTADGPRVRRAICSLMPPSRQREVLRAWNLAVDRTAGYLYSRTLLAAISALAHGVFFTIIGLPYGAALGVWVGVASQFIPTIGTYIAGVLPAIVALAVDPIDVVWLVLFMTVYQTLENYLLYPRLTAHTLSIHPAVAFGSVIAGAAILGPIGALLALPMVASIQAFASAYVRSYEVVAEPLTTDARAPGSTPADQAEPEEPKEPAPAEDPSRPKPSPPGR